MKNMLYQYLFQIYDFFNDEDGTVKMVIFKSNKDFSFPEDSMDKFNLMLT